jgi:hypothetical protein
MKLGKHGKINTKANGILKKLYYEKEIFACEVRLPGCKMTFALSWHHRHKRYWYYNQSEKLSLFSQTLLVCAACHEVLETSALLTEETFQRIRGDE